MAQCNQVPTQTRVDTITSISLSVVTFFSPTTLPPTTTQIAVVSIGPLVGQFGETVIPGQVTTVPATTTSTVLITSQQTTTLFGLSCAPSPTTAPTTTTATVSSMGPVTLTPSSTSSQVIITSSSESSVVTPAPALVTSQANQDTVTLDIASTTPTSSDSMIEPPQSTGPGVPDHSSSGSVAKNNMGAIVGGSVGGVMLIGISALIIYILRRRRKKAEWDDAIKDQWIGGTGAQEGELLKSKTSSPQAHPTIIPFPRDASPTAFYQDPKANNRPVVLHRPGQSSATMFSPGHQQTISGARSYRSYQPPKSRSSSDDGYMKEGEGGRHHRAYESSTNSLLPRPYEGYLIDPMEEDALDNRHGGHQVTGSDTSHESIGLGAQVVEAPSPVTSPSTYTSASLEDKDPFASHPRQVWTYGSRDPVADSEPREWAGRLATDQLLLSRIPNPYEGFADMQAAPPSYAEARGNR